MFSITLTVAKQHRLLDIHNNFFMLGYITVKSPAGKSGGEAGAFDCPRAFFC